MISSSAKGQGRTLVYIWRYQRWGLATNGELLPLRSEGKLAARREMAGKPRDGDRPFHSQA